MKHTAIRNWALIILAAQLFIPARAFAQQNTLEYDAIKEQFTSAPAVASGQQLTIVVKNIEPLLIDANVKTQDIALPTQPSALSLFGPPKAPSAQQAGETIVDIVKLWPAWFTARIKEIAVEYTKAVKDHTDYKRENVSTVLSNLCEKADQPDLYADRSLTVEEIDKLLKAIEDKVKGDMDAKKNFDTYKAMAKAFVTSLATTPATVQSKYTMKANTIVRITVEFTARKTLLGADGILAPEKPDDIAVPKTSSSTDVTPSDAKRDDRIAPAIFFSHITDGQYFAKGDGGTPPKYSIAEQNGRDDAQFYYGQIWNFPVNNSGDFNFAVGAGTNGQKLAYFGGVSLRLGMKQGVPLGYVSFGFLGVQAKRLDKVSLGDPLAGATTTIPVRDRFIVGLGLGFSLRF